MNKYYVSCKIRGTATCLVEAKNSKEAIEKACSGEGFIEDWEIDDWYLDLLHFAENFDVKELIFLKGK